MVYSDDPSYAFPLPPGERIRAGRQVVQSEVPAYVTEAIAEVDQDSTERPWRAEFHRDESGELHGQHEAVGSTAAADALFRVMAAAEGYVHASVYVDRGDGDGWLFSHDLDFEVVPT